MGLLEPQHLVVILIIALIIFGPGKISQLGGSFGKCIKDFKKALKDGDADSPGSQAKAPGEKPGP